VLLGVVVTAVLLYRRRRRARHPNYLGDSESQGGKHRAAQL
jgi:hypothetical protein